MHTSCHALGRDLSNVVIIRLTEMVGLTRVVFVMRCARSSPSNAVAFARVCRVCSAFLIVSRRVSL